MMTLVPTPEAAARDRLARMKRRMRSSLGLLVRSAPTLTPAQKLVVLAILDFDVIEDESGRRADPALVGVNGLLWEGCAMSERQAAGHLRALAARGLLTFTRLPRRVDAPLDETRAFELRIDWDALADLLTGRAAASATAPTDPDPPIRGIAWLIQEATNRGNRALAVVHAGESSRFVHAAAIGRAAA